MTASVGSDITNNAVRQAKWKVRELPIGFYGLFCGDKLLSDDFHDEQSANIVRDAHNAAIDAAIMEQMDKDDALWSAKLAFQNENVSSNESRSGSE